MTREEARQIIATWLVSSKGANGQRGYIEGWFDEEDVEAFRMAIEALKAQDIAEELTQDLADRLNDAYANGYNAAKREIALSGEYERAYQRGKADATKWIPVSERLPSDGGNYLITVADLRLGHNGEHTVTMADFYAKAQKWNCLVDVYAWMPLPKPWEGGDTE